MAWQYHRRIAWADVDLTGQWRFSAALLIVEEAETDLMRSAGLINLVPLLPRVAVTIAFSHPVAFDTEVDVSLDLVSIGRSSIRYEFVITGPKGSCASGSIVAVYTSESGRPRRVPPAIRRALEHTASSPSGLNKSLSPGTVAAGSST